MLTLQSCPRYDRCSAPVCPLDPACLRTVHLSGEPVCYYLLATGKVGAHEVLAGDPVFAAAVEMEPAIIRRYGAVRRAVAAAALSQFRGANLRSQHGPRRAAGRSIGGDAPQAAEGPSPAPNPGPTPPEGAL